MSTLRTSNLIHGSSAVSNVVLDTQGRASFGPDGPNGRAALYVNPQNNRVGVNNESPSTTLDVDGAINTTGNLTVGGTLNLTGALTSDVINAGSGTAAAPSVSVGTTDNGLYSPGTDQVAISTNGTERMQIDSSGRLLVGTSTARAVGGESNSRLQIEGSGGSSNSWVNISRFADSAGSAVIQFGKSRSDTPGTYTVVQNNDTLGSINFAGADGTDLATYGAKIAAEVDGTPGTNDMPGRLTFWTTADGASSLSERMRIDSSGRLLVGTTSPINSGYTGGSLHLRNNAGGVVAFKRNDGSSTNSVGILEFHSSFGRSANIVVNNDGNHTGSSTPGAIVFSTTPSGTFNTPTERMRITSNGNVTVGGNTDGATPAWSSVRTAVRIDGAQPILYLNETDVATGSAGSYLGAASTNLYLGNAGGDLIFQTSPPDGSTTERGRFLSTGGLTFNGDTTQANALDDYEEGSFNPSVIGNTSAGTATYQYAVGDYTKVGRMVHVRIYVGWTGHTGTGALYVSGLPYNIVNYAAYGGPSVNYWNQMNPGPCNGISALWGIGSNYVYFYTNSVSGGSAASIAVQPLGSIIICGSYYVA